ncbi:MAG: hypothetical protein ISR59_03010 [Anaerolineales bacterium]|uniref:Uncharacterized protein n=1 Tax=Candidatus Desulfolinea nitratireducens TaxID=2841698 RepID=A0A8J6NJ78_9CHLR|nr:hypothetical protein [Candidatus Desulfolinea nitratireducens]MBL6960052.1 hypothetical protein [Anaerolineales bacterium]
MSKKILIFDMDGVLLKPIGYHRALKETVRLGAQALGYEGITLSDAEIAQFEGLGISSEWHSSAACMALLALIGEISLPPLFDSLKREPAQDHARLRLERAIQHLVNKTGADPAHAISIIRNSQSIDHSPTLNLFQEMILGSNDFKRIYGKNGNLDVESFLFQFDQPLLGADVRNRLLAWLKDPENGGVVMTNRPSRGMPDAHYGLQLVGLEGFPLVGYGEIEWLAEEVGENTTSLAKPSPVHALAASHMSFGRDMDTSMLDAYAALNGGGADVIGYLEGSEIWVFEDTPAGLISVGEMEKVLYGRGISVHVNKIGIARTPHKGEYLQAQGARIFEGVDLALDEIF